MAIPDSIDADEELAGASAVACNWPEVIAAAVRIAAQRLLNIRE
jgi:hypothetical protein